MNTIRSRLTSQGQISVPAQVRRKLGLGPGSILEWEEVGGQMLVRRSGTVSSRDIHQTLFPEPPARRTLAELKEARAAHVREKHARR